MWLNGALCDAALIDASDRGFLHGDGVFETLRAQHGTAWHLPRHLTRLRAGAAILQIHVKWPDAAIAAAIAQLTQSEANSTVRITLSRGPGPRGLQPQTAENPTLLITAAAAAPALPPAAVIIAAATTRNEHSPLAAIKSLNYLDSVLARLEAQAAGADDAILLNSAGRVAETCAGSLFVQYGPDWLTPPVSDGALPGIARALILEASLAQQRSLDPGDLQTATAAFIASSLGLRPICRLAGRDLAPACLTSFENATQPISAGSPNSLPSRHPSRS